MHERRQNSAKAVYMTVVTRAELQTTCHLLCGGHSNSGNQCNPGCPTEATTKLCKGFLTHSRLPRVDWLCTQELFKYKHCDADSLTSFVE